MKKGQCIGCEEKGGPFMELCVCMVERIIEEGDVMVMGRRGVYMLYEEGGVIRGRAGFWLW